LLSEGQDAYRLGIDLLMRENDGKPEAGDIALAFQMSERQRARSLLDLLVEARADDRQGVDGSLLDRERPRSAAGLRSQCWANGAEFPERKWMRDSTLEFRYLLMKANSARHWSVVQKGA